MEAKNSSDFTKGKVWRSIVAQAVPLTVAQMVQLLYNVVDRMYLGRLPGHLALTGLGLCLPIISILMVITCIGGYPLYMGPIHEVVEGNWGAMTANKYFITNKNYILFRTVEILLISVVAAIFPFFSDLLGFNIL